MKFYDNIGYASTRHLGGGVYEDYISVERKYYGDVIRDSVKHRQGDTIIPGVSLGNTFKIIVDAYANEHFGTMRYIEYLGVRWTIAQVTKEYGPRISIRVGGVYNGPTFSPPVDP